MTAGLGKMRVERATYYYWKYDKKDDIIDMDATKYSNRSRKGNLAAIFC